MLNELVSLEGKVAQVVMLCRALRTENDGLREQLATAIVDRQRLTERMAEASTRLEQLALQLPEARA
jgi:cell division protein ZapB